MDGTKEPLLEVLGRFSPEWESGWTRLAPGVKASWDSLTSSDPLYRWDRAMEVSRLALVAMGIPFTSDRTACNGGSQISPGYPVGL